MPTRVQHATSPGAQRNIRAEVIATYEEHAIEDGDSGDPVVSVDARQARDIAKLKLRRVGRSLEEGEVAVVADFGNTRHPHPGADLAAPLNATVMVEALLHGADEHMTVGQTITVTWHRACGPLLRGPGRYLVVLAAENGEWSLNARRPVWRVEGDELLGWDVSVLEAAELIAESSR